jgi:methylmalonyl-CoA/ethylmalonyl-CoA epimerase
MRKIDHIGIAVRDLSDATKRYSDIGFQIKDQEEVPTEKVKVAFITIGESHIELLQPTDSESPIAKFIKKRGEGIHHIAIEVENIEERLSMLKHNGVRLIDEKPRKGSRGTKVAFIHPKALNGVLLELCMHPS